MTVKAGFVVYLPALTDLISGIEKQCPKVSSGIQVQCSKVVHCLRVGCTKLSMFQDTQNSAQKNTFQLFTKLVAN